MSRCSENDLLAVPRPERSSARGGSIVLELILALPLLAAMVLTLVEIGMLVSNQLPLAMASRAGAQVASATVLATSGPVPPQVESAVRRVLAASGMAPGRITVRHNVGPAPPYELDSGILNCPAPTLPAPPSSSRYVRVTVCTEATQLAPNLLTVFGFDLTGRVYQKTTTRGYGL